MGEKCSNCIYCVNERIDVFVCELSVNIISVYVFILQYKCITVCHLSMNNYINDYTSIFCKSEKKLMQNSSKSTTQYKETADNENKEMYVCES